MSRNETHIDYQQDDYVIEKLEERLFEKRQQYSQLADEMMKLAKGISKIEKAIEAMKENNDGLYIRIDPSTVPYPTNLKED